MNTVSRRQFLRSAAAGAATRSSFSSVLCATVPDRTLKPGLIGCGWFRGVEVEAAFKFGGVEVFGLCDVDSAHLANLLFRHEQNTTRQRL